MFYPQVKFYLNTAFKYTGIGVIGLAFVKIDCFIVKKCFYILTELEVFRHKGYQTLI